jgi:ketosteroid isomerase-like protein
MSLISISPRRSLGLMLIFAFLFSVCAQLLLAGPPKIHKPDNRRQIDRLEETWRVAMIKADVKTMSALLADDYMAITPSGTLQTKEQALASLSSSRRHVTILDISDRKVRFYGKTALVTSIATVKATNPEGEEISGSFRYTRVYVRDVQGNWRIVSFEANRIREQGDHK